MTVTYLLDLCFHIPLVLEEHNLGYDKGFGGASKVVFGGMIDRIDHIQMAFDLKKSNIGFRKQIEFVQIKHILIIFNSTII